ncbi:D-alanine--D-alanine ligase [Sulfuriflexus sp.]|uniref:D-alanine--D-alanine ligase n=1 Tax=Sulfuriflexus sp. TaxID=2015443 RepID=UPI0028CF90B7|nr:D-alanine--D-alanine ligase [Sulfuriflexus sp.]MDT8404323.1 D-alanine--D-alanine ligase [Sulfuriflexus sp.]
MMQSKDIVNQDFGKVAVLMGGNSAEREVSLHSGQAVLAALRARGVDAYAVDPASDNVHDLPAAGYTRAFIILHGRGGEDGAMQAVLESIGLPYTGSRVLGSALSMDKLRCKWLWQGAGLPTPAWRVLKTEEDAEQAGELGLPLMVKPAREGSSIGISKVESVDRLKDAWVFARQYDDSVIAEQFIDGEEYTVTILAGEALPVIRLQTPREFYDYEAKYQSNDTRYLCPCGLAADAEVAMQQLAMQAAEVAAVEGWGRVDLMRDAQGNNWLIEVNTVPGMTDHSLVPMAAQAAGIEFDELVMRILATSLDEEERT